MAGWPRRKISLATRYENAMSVAHGMAQPRISSPERPIHQTITAYIDAGTAIPPTAARTGVAACLGSESGPPGRVASYTSFATRPKKNTIAT
jgi:hypothetical protein